MAYDIGPKIGIEGEAEFRKSIKQINQTIKTLDTEMAAVTSAYDKNDKSAENLTGQNKVLNKQLEAQRKKLKKVKDMLAASAKETGENSEQTQKWQAVVNTATAKLNKMERQLRENNDALQDMDFDQAFRGVDDLIASMDSISIGSEDAARAIDDLDNGAGKLKKGFSALKVAAGNLLSGGISALASGALAAARAFVNLDKSTEEYRIAQGKLNTAFEAAGMNAEFAKETYTEFFKLLGDTGTAAEASQLLAKLADDTEDLSKWTGIAAGVYGTFGDALPINGLIESSNETVKTGKVTGVLADALNWAGINEEEFNAQLAAASDEIERNRLLMDTLAGVYDEASDAFYRNNEQIVEARENQAKLDEVTGRLGESVGRVKNALILEFGPALVETGNDIADFIDDIDTDELFRKFDQAWKFTTAVWDGAGPYFFKVGQGIARQTDTDGLVLKFSKAWKDITDVWDGAGDYFFKVGQGIARQIVFGLGDSRAVIDGAFGSGKGGSFGGSGGSSSVNTDAIAAAVERGMSGMSVNLNGRKVGRMLSVMDADDARAGGFAPARG